MNKKTLELELKVGMFITIGAGLVMLATILLGGAETVLTRHNQYTTHFESVDGLITGAKVVLNGIRVGLVASITLTSEKQNIELVLNIEKNYEQWIREDSIAEIATQGVLGDKYISLQAGSLKKEILPARSEIPHKETKDFSQFFSRGDQLLISLTSIASSMERLLKSFETQNRQDLFFDGMARTAQNLASATAKIDTQLDEIKLKAVIKNLTEIMEKINQGTGTLGALVNDPALYDDMRSLVGGANRNRIMRNLVRKTIKDSEEKE